MQIVDHFDTPEVLDTSITPIPKSIDPPLQVIAALANTCFRIVVKDGIGTSFIGIYAGPAGQEIFITAVGGPGPTEYDVYIPRGTRISIRNMYTLAIASAGDFYVHFLGQ